MEYKPFGQPHEVLVTSVIPMDRPLEVATDLAGRMIGPVTVVTDDKMVGAVSLKVESGDDPHYNNANYGPVNPPEYDSNEYRYVALWVKPGSGRNTFSLMYGMCQKAGLKLYAQTLVMIQMYGLVMTEGSM